MSSWPPWLQHRQKVLITGHNVSTGPLCVLATASPQWTPLGIRVTDVLDLEGLCQSQVMSGKPCLVSYISGVCLSACSRYSCSLSLFLFVYPMLASYYFLFSGNDLTSFPFIFLKDFKWHFRIIYAYTYFCNNGIYIYISYRLMEMGWLVLDCSLVVAFSFDMGLNDIWSIAWFRPIISWRWLLKSIGCWCHIFVHHWDHLFFLVCLIVQKYILFCFVFVLWVMPVFFFSLNDYPLVGWLTDKCSCSISKFYLHVAL